ncbi:DUF320 domain-containing protein [Streptomyces sp. HNM0575]|uniref:chaplin n=1 Tax=Streptomyces sp. HNM0575 TaxID=2716338 RepID=UPI00145F668A|nr:chaplin [Streptomyces sp. HNM0575]NLU75224.1 DUF320 domain-containing protein [Streptomyces sp. HNM0575]
MRQVTRKGLITVAAAGGVLATFSGGTAFADTGSGLLSGNSVNAPINVPTTVCGNTVSVLGSLNSAAACGGSSDSRSAAPSGTAVKSDEIGSGNNVNAPVDIPIGVCGNNVSALGDGNTAGDCAGSEAAPPVSDEPDNPGPDEPGQDEDCDEPGSDNPGSDNPGPSDDQGGGSDQSSDVNPASDVRTQSEPGTEQLAHTGAGDMLGVAAPLSAGLLLGGFVLYRRASKLARR